MQTATTHKLTHEQAVQQLQEAMLHTQQTSTLDTADVANIPALPPTPMDQLLLSTPHPIPPQLDTIDTEEGDGYFVDETDLQLAQSRVKRWLELDAEIATLSTAMRERRRQKEDINKHLIAFMQGNHVPRFEMSKGNLSLEVSKHKQPLNQKWIATQIQTVDGITPDQQDTLMKVIFDDRSVTEKPRLKHKKGKS